MELIVAFDNNFGISKNGNMPWHIKEDLKFFNMTTINNVVIMGKNTFLSLSSKSLKCRLNIILTSKPDEFSCLLNIYTNIIFTNDENIYVDLLNDKEQYTSQYPFLDSNYKVFIIGGETVYNKYEPLCNILWTTQIHDNYNCDRFFNFNSDNYNELFIKTTDIYTIKKYVKLA